MYRLNKIDKVGVVLKINLTEEEKKEMQDKAHKGKLFLRKATDEVVDITDSVAKIEPKPWWPICFLCKKVVDNLVLEPQTAEQDIYQKAVRRYYSVCHGKQEHSLVGLWAAEEYQRTGRRLPDAFKGHTYEDSISNKQLE